MTDPPARLESVQRLATTDRYWRAYLDGLTDKHHVLEASANGGGFSHSKETP